MVGSNSPILKKIISVCILMVFSVLWYNILSLYLPSSFFDSGFLLVLVLGISFVLWVLATWIESNFWRMISKGIGWIFTSLFLSWILYHILQWLQPLISVLNDLLLWLFVLASFFVFLHILKNQFINFTFEDIEESVLPSYNSSLE
ncbi:hypothetical protein METP2_02580 [Methanosarcinales archaeon]|nr:hypothetical protein METP2_02580 [Methanosarcinales archaeon]